MLLIIELGFISIGLNPDEHVVGKDSVSVIVRNDSSSENNHLNSESSKRARIRSSDDFMPTYSQLIKENVISEDKKGKTCTLTPVLKSVSDFKNLPDQTVLQVTEIFPPQCDADEERIHLSDGEVWVTSYLTKVKNYL